MYTCNQCIHVHVTVMCINKGVNRINFLIFVRKIKKICYTTINITNKE